MFKATQGFDGITNDEFVKVLFKNHKINAKFEKHIVTLSNGETMEKCYLTSKNHSKVVNEKIIYENGKYEIVAIWEKTRGLLYI